MLALLRTASHTTLRGGSPTYGKSWSRTKASKSKAKFPQKGKVPTMVELSPIPRRPRKPYQASDQSKRKCMVCKKNEDFRKKMRAQQKEKRTEAKAKAGAGKNAE